jgi:hypothetical protein
MIQPVAQESHSGCFIACVAMLIGGTYEDGFKLVHPRKDMYRMYEHGFMSMSVEKTAHRVLRKLGIKTHTGKYRKLKTYVDRVKKNAILIVRWKFDPTRCHCILFDAKEKRFIDPSGGYVIGSDYELKSLERQLECPIVIDKIPNRLKVQRDIHRDASLDREERRDNTLRQDSYNTDEQVALLQATLWRMAAERAAAPS